jgi:hypothetical protein
VFEDVTVTDIRGGGLATSVLYGCLYHHVVLRGWFGGVMFRWQVDQDDKAFSRRFLTANLTAYASMDWALDVSEASFSIYQSLLGVPASLVRRNPDRHFLLNQDNARKLVADATVPLLWKLTADELVRSGLPDTVVVSGGAGKPLKAQLAEAELLRSQGFLQ